MSAEQKRFVIRAGGYPVKLVHNHCGNVFSVCHIDDASQFYTQEDAAEAAELWRLKEHFHGKPIAVVAYEESNKTTGGNSES